MQTIADIKIYDKINIPFRKPFEGGEKSLRQSFNPISKIISLSLHRCRAARDVVSTCAHTPSPPPLFERSRTWNVRRSFESEPRVKKLDKRIFPFLSPSFKLRIRDKGIQALEELGIVYFFEIKWSSIDDLRVDFFNRLSGRKKVERGGNDVSRSTGWQKED